MLSVLQVGLLPSRLLSLFDEGINLVGAQSVCHLPKKVPFDGLVLIVVRQVVKDLWACLSHHKVAPLERELRPGWHLLGCNVAE